MPYHSFFLGGAHRLQAFFLPVEWKEVSLMEISKTTGASYLQMNAPGSMRRPSPAGRPLGAPLPYSKSIPEELAHSFLTSHTYYLGLVKTMGMSR